MRETKELIARRLFETIIQFRRTDWPPHEHHHELTHTEMMILVHVAKNSKPAAGALRATTGDADGETTGIKAPRLSSLLRVSPPPVTQQGNSLVTRGYLIREPDPADRRAVNIRLSEKGIETIRLVGREIISELTGLVDHLGKERSVELIDLLADAFEWLRHRRGQTPRFRHGPGTELGRGLRGFHDGPGLPAGCPDPFSCPGQTGTPLSEDTESHTEFRTRRRPTENNQ